MVASGGKPWRCSLSVCCSTACNNAQRAAQPPSSRRPATALVATAPVQTFGPPVDGATQLTPGAAAGRRGGRCGGTLDCACDSWRATPGGCDGRPRPSRRPLAVPSADSKARQKLPSQPAPPHVPTHTHPGSTRSLTRTAPQGSGTARRLRRLAAAATTAVVAVTERARAAGVAAGVAGPVRRRCTAWDRPRAARRRRCPHRLQQSSEQRRGEAGAGLASACLCSSSTDCATRACSSVRFPHNSLLSSTRQDAAEGARIL